MPRLSFRNRLDPDNTVTPVEISVSAGSWLATGLAPAVSAPVAIAVPAGSWRATGRTPVAQDSGASLSVSDVTGTLTHGSTLTITGAGFGAHADYGGAQPFLCVAWNDLDTAIAGGNWGLDGVNNAAWTYETSNARTNAEGWARKRYDAGIDESIRRLGEYTPNDGGLMSGTTGTFFISCWFRPETNADGKFFRIYGDHGDIFLNAHGDSGGSCANSRGLSGLSNVSGTPTPSTLWGTTNEFTANGWHRVDIYMRDTSGDDYMSVHVDGTRFMQRGSTLPSNAPSCGGTGSNERQQWVYSPWDGDNHSVGLGHMIDVAGWGFDDVFANYTQARIEVSDSSTWAGASHREIQIPLTWGTTEITIQANRGSFASLEGLYLYVVTADGSVNSAGFPL